jgi:hypothetical protein
VITCAANRKRTETENLIEEHFKLTSPQYGRTAGNTASEAELDSEASEELPQRRHRMLAAREEASADLFSRNESAAALKQRPLFERAAEAPGETKAFRSGSRNISFVPTQRCARLALPA